MDGWTIYDHPSDYPDCWVARRWVIQGGQVVPTDEVHTAATLRELRERVSPGRGLIPRHQLDDPRIVEVWL